MVKLSVMGIAALALLGGCAHTGHNLASDDTAKPAAVRVDNAKSPPPNKALSSNEISQDDARSNLDPIVKPRIKRVLTVKARSDNPDLWDRIRSGFAMNELDSPLVEENEQWYQARPDYVRRMVDRSKRYLFHIVAEVERRGMPSEIALLPYVESAYNPVAYSRSHASGIWQFIPSTGKHFGLQQNFWYDGRRDILAATNAALDYLEKLHGMFGSWELALAAYNWGEGSVSRAIAKNQAAGLPTDYLSLQMPSETRSYVPRLIAVKHLIMDPEAFGLQIASIPNRSYFAPVAKKPHIDVALAAKLAEVPVEEFVSLNPAHTKPVIAQAPQPILLPADKVETFNENLRNYDKPLVSWQSYTTGKKERLDKIAHKFRIALDKLKEINGIAAGISRLTAQTLLVPLAPARWGAQVAQAEISALKRTATQNTAPEPRKAVYVVKRGDTLFSIAQRHNLSVSDITSWNNLSGGRVTPNQRLTLRLESDRAGNTSDESLKEKLIRYTVRPGDTLYSIARQFRVAVESIQQWNGWSEKRPLRTGEKITLYNEKS